MKEPFFTIQDERGNRLARCYLTYLSASRVVVRRRPLQQTSSHFALAVAQYLPFD